MSYLLSNSLMHWPPALVEMLFLHDDPPSAGARNVAFSTQFFLPSWVAPSLMMGMVQKSWVLYKSWRNGFYSARLFWISFVPIFEEVKFAYSVKIKHMEITAILWKNIKYISSTCLLPISKLISVIPDISLV